MVKTIFSASGEAIKKVSPGDVVRRGAEARDQTKGPRNTGKPNVRIWINSSSIRSAGR